MIAGSALPPPIRTPHRDGVTTEATGNRKTLPGKTSWTNRRVAELRAAAPGLGLACAVMAIVLTINHYLPALSPLLVAIVLGAVLANVVALPQRLQPGLQFSGRRLLRSGVALLGLQLTFSDILGLGPVAIIVVVAIVGSGIGFTMWLGRFLGISWSQRLLIACGFSICGAAAAAAVDGVIDAEDEELLTALALVVVFGTVMIGVIPLLADTFGLDQHTGGIWAGGAIHEVAQVVAAGGAIGGAALTVGVVVKLARVVLLAPVLAIVGWQVRRTSPDRAAAKNVPLMPLFVLAFLGCAALRTTGIVPAGVLGPAKLLQTALLTAAMFAIGAGVRLTALAKVGPRPIVLAAASTGWIAAVALGGALLAG